ncbi:MAG: alpha/beta fold hydrolase [Zhengella sp.]|uniref:alpha/beta fold hydrolase n=1 Tax=Zhengella sp. TaxID=2282762 RepID=UPI001D500D17|nr:alpha/beta fold hydrolase [Notoacmeibacter sp.]MCC0027548.1 alpha/beta fold hydrolase [Brucellaceae bacterium]
MSENLFCVRRGEGGEPLVLLHGFGGSHHVWEPVAAALAARRLVLTPDLPGHGLSLTYPGAGPVKVAVQAVLDHMDGQGISRFHLAGHSMGGAIAALIAMAAPDRVASLTLLAPGGFGPEINIRLLIRYAQAVSREDLLPCLEEMVGYRNPVNGGALDKLAELRARDGQRAMLTDIAARMTRDGIQGAIPRDALAALPMPVKVIWGTEDRVLPSSQTRDLPPLFALHLFAGTGHMLIDEQTDAVIRLISENAR